MKKVKEGYHYHVHDLIVNVDKKLLKPLNKLLLPALIIWILIGSLLGLYNLITSNFPVIPFGRGYKPDIPQDSPLFILSLLEGLSFLTAISIACINLMREILLSIFNWINKRGLN